MRIKSSIPSSLRWLPAQKIYQDNQHKNHFQIYNFHPLTIIINKIILNSLSRISRAINKRLFCINSPQ